MKLIADAVMFGWIPVVLLIFAVLPPRRAVLTAFIAGWLFLPMAGYRFSGLPEYSKMSATCAGVLLGVALFDARRLLAFRPGWVDLPAIVWCLSPIATSLLNGLGLKDGVSLAVNTTVTWGLAYVIGRLYFCDLRGLRELALAIFIGGLIYAPLCLLEIKLSPQLHKWVYGFYQHSFSQTRRLGGWRPMVFLQHGLMLGLWMTSASLIGVWLWTSRSVRVVMGMPMIVLVPALVGTTILCKSFGALLLLGGGLGALFASKWLKTRLIVAVLVVTPLLYMGTRMSGVFTGDRLVSIVTMISPQRAKSLQTRLSAEDKLLAHARARPFFGWGGWNRSHVLNENGKDIAPTDGMWVIAVGQKGMVGLSSFTAIMLLPTLLLLRRSPPSTWSRAALAAPGALGVFMLLFSIDNLMNAMENPVYMLIAGGLSGLALPRGRHELEIASGVKRRALSPAQSAAQNAARLAGAMSRPAPARAARPVAAVASQRNTGRA